MTVADGKITVTLDRRGFLAGIGVVFSSVPVAALSGSGDAAVSGTGVPQRAVIDQMPYVSFDGTGRPFDATRSNNSTRDYVNSLSREEYLRRHCFI